MELRSDRLRVFAAVVEAGSFSAAGRKLGLPQSSVSQAVAALEHDVGEPLFNRAPRIPALTPAGRVLAAHAARVLAEVERAARAMDELKEAASGRLTLGTTDTLASFLLPPVFAAFRSSYPEVQLTLHNQPSPVIAARVASQELDAGVVSLPLPPTTSPAVQALIRTPLCPQRDVIITPPGHPLSRRKRARVGALAGEDLVLLDRTTTLRPWLDTQLEAAKIAPRVVMEMSSVEVIKRLVELGFGLSVIPRLAVRRDDRLGVVALTGVAPRRWVGLLSPAQPTRATRWFAGVASRLLGGTRSPSPPFR